jgi:hypothetical protein
MSRSQTRARNRRARLEKLRAEFEAKRHDPEAFVAGVWSRVDGPAKSLATAHDGAMIPA